jgi:SAM-dependent methyltransferase/uncharacterized membrane protein YbhN (UPF0104 family)
MASNRTSAAASLTAAPPPAAPRPLVFLILAASGVAAVVAGAVATAHLLWQVDVPWRAIPRGHWVALGLALVLTLLSLGLRSLRWVFLLRRLQVYVPLRDSLVAYLAGLSLLVLPLLAGEALVRGMVARERRIAPAEPMVLVTYLGRAFDVLALVVIAAALSGPRTLLAAFAVVLLAAAALGPVRWAGLRAVRAVARFVARLVWREAPSVTDAGARRLAGRASFLVAFVLSLGAWVLPGAGLWLLARAWSGALSLGAAEAIFARATLAGAGLLAPGGVLVVVFAVRAATAGLAVALGAAFLVYHVARRGRAIGSAHFDAIAGVYDAQIPEGRRLALLARKTTLMRDVLASKGARLAGLDVGCGQGHYVKRMRELGFDVLGMDDSAQQVESAARLFVEPDLVRRGSMLAIPFEDARFDFVYTINVLHHLDSVESQRRAFLELARVLKPGGTLFVHEINTRNWLFRFYMGYLFPALNCIDEGVERWLLPDRLGEYTDLPVARVEHFTFLPEFVPPALVRWLTPLERRLERSRWGCYSAHYMAVFEKP